MPYLIHLQNETGVFCQDIGHVQEYKKNNDNWKCVVTIPLNKLFVRNYAYSKLTTFYVLFKYDDKEDEEEDPYKKGKFMKGRKMLGVFSYMVSVKNYIKDRFSENWNSNYTCMTAQNYNKYGRKNRELNRILIDLRDKTTIKDTDDDFITRRNRATRERYGRAYRGNYNGINKHIANILVSRGYKF